MKRKIVYHLPLLSDPFLVNAQFNLWILFHNEFIFKGQYKKY